MYSAPMELEKAGVTRIRLKNMIKSLYKYMEFKPDFFDKLLLRATPRRSLNDPFEARLTSDLFENIAHTVDVERSIKELNLRGFNGITIEDFFEYERSRADSGQTDSLGLPFYDTTGVVSLTETNDNLLMWAHYAKEHQGMVVEFDHKHDFFTKDHQKNGEEIIGHINRVLYRKDRITKLDHFYGIFLEKSDEWIYEKEHRLLLSLHDADVRIIKNDDVEEFKKTKKNEDISYKYFNKDFKEITGYNSAGKNPAMDKVVFLFKVPPTAIKSIALGVKLTPEQKQLIEDKIKAEPALQHIKLTYAEVDRRHYRINITDKPLELA